MEKDVYPVSLRVYTKAMEEKGYRLDESAVRGVWNYIVAQDLQLQWIMEK